MTPIQTAADRRQRRLVLIGYVVHIVALLAALAMPLVVLLPIVYRIAVRPFVTSAWLRSHVNWQLVTVIVAIGAIVGGLALIAVAFSTVNQQPTARSIASGWAGAALWIAVPLWLVYRFIRGLISFGKEARIERLLP